MDSSEPSWGPSKLVARGRAIAGTISLWWVGLRVASQALEFVGWILIANAVSPTDLGRLTVSYLICRYAGLGADWGAAFGGTRLVARDPLDGRIVALARRRSRLTVAAMIVVGGGLAFTGGAALVPLIGVTAYRGANREWLSLGRGDQVAGGVPPAVATMGFVLGGMIGADAADLALWIGGSQAVGLLVSVVLAPLPRVSPPDGAPLDGWLTVLTLSDQLYISSDTILLAWLRSSKDAGIYSTLYRFPAAWVAVVGLVALGSLPHVAVASDRHALLRSALRRGSVLGGLLLAAGPLIYIAVRMTLGEEFSDEISVIALLVVAMAIASFIAPLAVLFVTQRSDRELATTALAVGVVNVAANLALIPSFGMVAAAATTIVSYVALGVFYVRRLSGDDQRPADSARSADT